MPSLLDLPGETVGHIASFLPKETLLETHLICKDLNAKTFSFFLKTHFSTRHHVLSRFGLQTLVDISAHETLGPCVKKVNLSWASIDEKDAPEYYLEPESDGIDADGDDARQKDAIKQVARHPSAHSQMLGDKNYLFNSGAASRMIS